MKIQLLLVVAMLFAFSFEAHAVNTLTMESTQVVTTQQSNGFIAKVQQFASETFKSAKAIITGQVSPKSQLIALLLCLFVGGLGIHRFYLGYTTIGVIQLLTLGGLGIWVLIDLIRLITGDLKPKDGSNYDPSL